MTAVFADTSYYYALLSRADQFHDAAVRVSRRLTSPVVTSEFVLLELGNSLAMPKDRDMFVRLVRTLRGDERVTIVPASDNLFEAGLRLYESRKDKSWSLTDCTSFVVMQEQGIREALSADHHFEQAGFTILLR